jgi:two-component system, sensor histidine kinase and response regulator
MDRTERDRIDRITEVVHYLLKGRIPDPIPVADDPDDEIRQLSEKVNQLRTQLGEVKESIVPLSQGRLDVDLPRGNFLASPFKQLQSSLSHLTWQTRQIAQGDFNQRVDFMGDFSRSFNAMVEALAESRNQLLAEGERYRKLADLRNHYLNVMAHDIRTPVGAILGFADILLEGNVGPKEKKHLRIIKRNCDTILGLINNILDMAKLENRRMEIDAIPFSLSQLCGDLAEMIQSKLADGVQFELDIDETLPDRLVGDPRRLEQVLLNLVGNAAKFTEAGRITLQARPAPEPEGGPVAVDFAVIDTGPGIPEDRIEEIFTPFVQAGTDRSRRGGTGLGLAIAAELVSLMGGDLRVDSEVGRGSAFSFVLPFSVGEETEADDRSPCRGHCHILVVDDDPYSLKIIDRLLTGQRVRFQLCQDSRKAIERLRSAQASRDPFTLAWLDIDMPELNGFELARQIRSDPRLNRLRLIACTSHIDKVGDADAPDYFSFVATKPITPPALRRILAEASVSDMPPEADCDLTGCHALVVDDNPVNRFILKTMLEKLGMVQTEAENGRHGIDCLDCAAFDIVIMDKNMPEMDGVTAIREIRRDPNRHHLPVLAFTADDADEDRESLLAAGADDILTKPVSHDNLRRVLCRVLDRNTR